MKRRVFALVLVIAMLFAVQGVFASAAAEDSKPATQEEVVLDHYPVVYWTTYTGANGEFIQGIIDEFNASQTQYTVTMQYNGNYADQLAKLQVSDDADRPNLINGSTEQTGTYRYCDFIKPLSEIASADDEYVANLYGNLVATWGNPADGSMFGYPMGNSLSGIMVNMYICEAAGIDPYSWTCLEDVYRDCYKVVNGGFAEFAIGTDHSSIYTDYALAIEGVPSCDNNNGGDALPTKALYNVEPTKSAAKKYFEIWQNLSADKICYPLGSSWGNECLPAFASGQIAFLTGTIGGYGRVERAWATAHAEDGKKINVVFIPWLPVTSNGRGTGLPASGNGFYFIEKGDDIGAQGAWEFVKYFTSPEVQSRWCVLTGYLPTNDTTMTTETYQNYINNRFPTVVDVIAAQQASDSISYYPINMIDSEWKAAGKEAIEKVAADPTYNLDKLLDELTEEVNDALEMWHLSND